MNDGVVVFNWKNFLKVILVEMFASELSKLSPKLNTQYSYFLFNRKFMNLKNPQTFAEKISWLKINKYAQDALVRKCADKLAVREYVQAKGFGHMLNELIAVFDDVNDIDWYKLPDAFVLKWNFGSGFNFLCHNKNEIDIKSAEKKLKQWGKKKFWLFFSELQYKVAHKCILCERFLDTPDSALIDYKFYCFHGKVRAVLVIERVNENAERAVFMTPSWNFMSDINYKYKDFFIPDKPKSLFEMKQAAEKLSGNFPFVRVDFYEWQGKPIFGEMTFTPAAGMNPSETLIDGKQMGEYISLD